MKDPRLFIKVTLDFPDDEKIAPLSDAAFRALIEMIVWSRKKQSDGWLASRLALAKWSLDVLQELSANHPERPSLIASESGWQIHDYAEIQETKADIEARQARNKLNGQKGGLAKGKRPAKRPASDSVSENVAEIETEIDRTPTAKAVGGTTRKRAAKPRARIPANYMPSRQTTDKIRTEFPGVTDTTLRSVHEDFCLYWQGQGKPMADWDATWLRWMRKELAKTKPATNGSAVDTKVSDWIDLANKQPHLKAIGE